MEPRVRRRHPPRAEPTGVSLSRPLPVGAWSCVEFTLDGGALTTHLDGAEVPGLVKDSTPTHDIDRQWLTSRPDWRPTPNDFRLGWESYGSATDTLWFDDITLSTTRVGC